jgi:hypothetical protein
VLNVTHGFPHLGQFGGHDAVACESCAGLIAAVSWPITGAMFWTSPHARLLFLVVGSAVALALLAVSPARRGSHEHPRSVQTMTFEDATPGSRAHERRVYLLSQEPSRPHRVAR